MGLGQIFSVDSKHYKTGTLSFVEFPEHNNIIYYQDFGVKKNIPAGIKFYPESISTNNEIWFIGDRHGVLPNNPYGLTGEYGSGKINVPIRELPVDLVEWCRYHLLKKA